ncbi:hypothetical protein FisN_30Lh112 [Fistulifera solaris]|uniref:N-acetyltransferase domain-containing protein n=1 Tax=Fistulifera solaris TaxID=1519565 RepID=A0A1Z5JII4_FISSO|nr:hypothetical protein FisN_30Lh112 [Fistulifera solaris]|eukprot:GAX13817.1 hypothetical protein FisN_30Lh112 [Fistulifera solaris]
MHLARLRRAALCCFVGIAFAYSLSVQPHPQPRPSQQKQTVESLQQKQLQHKILLLTRQWSSYSHHTSPKDAYKELLQLRQQSSLIDPSSSWEAPTLAVLKLCYRHYSNRNHRSTLTNSESYADWAYSVWQTLCPESLAARHVVLQNYSQQLQQAKEQASHSPQAGDTRHFATATLWNQIVQLLSLSDHHSNRFTTNVALLNSALAAAPTGHDALLLYEQTHTTTPWTTLSYNLLLGKLTPDRAMEFLEINMIRTQRYNRQSFEIVARGHSNDESLERLRQLCVACYSDESASTKVCDNLHSSQLLEKQSRKRTPWPDHILQRWNDGNVTSMKHFVVATNGFFTLTAQPNRQSYKDLRLILWSTSHPRQKIGYMLLTTAESKDISTTTSSLMGVYLDPQYRQHGLSKQFIDGWIQLCRKAQLVPRTEIIRKPLLCLVLQHSFGFVPDDSHVEGVNIEIYPPQREDASTNQIRVYSPTRCLEGIFSPWDVQREQLHLCVQRPLKTKGRTIRAHGRFVLPPTTTTTASGDRSLNASHASDSSKGLCSLTEQELRTILVGEDNNHKRF